MKLLLAQRNTLWGVIVNPRSSNQYRHVLSFDSPQLKDEWLNKEIFNNQNHKDLLKSSPHRDITYIDGLRIEFRVEPTEYPNETFYSLMNKDFVVMEDTSVNPSEYRYYAITSAKRKGNTVQYEAELDIFFTYDIKDMFNDTDVQVSRGMVDRYFQGTDDKGVHALYPIHLQGGQDFRSPFYASDDYEESLAKSTLPASTPKPALFDYTPFLEEILVDNEKILGDNAPHTLLKNEDSQLNDEIKEYANEILNSINWEIVHYKIDGGGIESHIRCNSRNVNNNLQNLGIKPNHINLERPISARVSIDDGNRTPIYDQRNNIGDLYFAQGFLNKELQDPKLIKNTRHISSIPPYAGFISDKNFKVQIVVRLTPDPTQGKLNYIDINLLFGVERVNDSGGNPTGDYNLFDADSREITLYTKPYSGGTSFNNVGFVVREIQTENDAKTRRYGSKKHTKHKIAVDLEIFKPIHSLSINTKVVNTHPNEPKLDFYPFRYFSLKNFSPNSMVIAPQNIIGFENKLTFKVGFGYLVDSWTQWAVIDNYKKQWLPNDQIANNENQFFSDTTSYSLYTETNAWEEYSIRNKSQMQTSITSAKVNAGMGIAGAGIAGATSALTGNPLGVIGAIFGGASIASKSMMEINKIKALKQDLHNTPNSIVNSGTTLPMDLNMKVNQLNITEYRLDPLLDLMVREHIYKYGYNFKGKLEKASKVLNNRYYFNYIEIQDCYENVKIQLSAEAKQLINDTLNTGLTVWNVRDLATFKGIKNYDYENVEMSLI